MASEAAAADAGDRKDPVASVAGHLTVLSTRDHALLRRMYLTGKPAADGVVIKLLAHAEVDPVEYRRDYIAWQLLTHAAAVLSGTGKKNPHNSKRGFGEALFEAGYSENRLLRLTAVRGEPLRDQLVLSIGLLAHTGVASFNLWTLLSLIGRDRGRAEKARIRIAQDYYAAAARQGRDTK